MTEHEAALQAIADRVLAEVQHETVPNQMAGIAMAMGQIAAARIAEFNGQVGQPLAKDQLPGMVSAILPNIAIVIMAAMAEYGRRWSLQ